MARSRWLVLLAALGVALAGARLAGGEDKPAPIPAELTFTYHQSWVTKPEPGMQPSKGSTDYSVTMRGNLEIVQQNGDADFRREMLTNPRKPKGSAYTFTLPDEITFCTGKPDGDSHYRQESIDPLVTTRTEGTGSGGRIAVSLETTGAGDDLYPYAGLAQIALDSEKRTVIEEDGTKVEKSSTFAWPPGGAAEEPWVMEKRQPASVLGDAATPAPFMKGLSFEKLSKAIASGKSEKISGTESWSYSDEAGTTFTGSSSVKLTVRPPGYEAILTPVARDAYDEWMPEGPAPPKHSGVGNTIAFKVVLRDKKTHAEVKNVPFKSRFRLEDVSRMDGTCTNYPQPKKKDGSAPSPEDSEFFALDLEFAKDANASDATIEAEGQELTTADGKGGDPVSVSACDWGAWGSIRASAITKDGDVPAKADPELPADKGGPTISIPRDDNRNHVADAWEKEKEHDVFDRNLPASWDKDDKFGKQRRAGDGYTLYEEYRGFATLVDGMPKHVRTDPLAKDCFVCDVDGLFKANYEKENPSKLVWHYVDASMFRYLHDATEDMKALDPNHRWVNTNSDETNKTGTFYARQYCVVILNHWVDEKGGGDAQDYNALRFVEKKSQISGLETPQKAAMKDVYRVCVSVKLLTAVSIHNYGEENAKIVIPAQVKTTVIHEVGHAIGIRHHRPVDQRNADGTGDEDDSVNSGVPHCAMHYPDAKEVHDVPFMKKGQFDYCQAGETFKDKDGNDVPGDDCFDQIDVKSDP